MDSLAGWRIPFTLNLKRDRWFWFWWILTLSLMIPITAGAYSAFIPENPIQADLVIRTLRTNAAMLAILGSAFELSTKPGFVFWRSGGFATFFAAMMAGMAIIRSTRAEEDAGRLELLRSGPIGRHAPLFAALLTNLLGSLLCGFATTILAIIAELPVAGSIAAGLGMTTLALIFTGLGAVAAQIAASARVARVWTIGVIFGGMFCLRMMIDGAGSVSSLAAYRWLIPLEWPLLARPYATERWWVYGLSLAVAISLIPIAFWLESRRDHLAGLIPDRQGRDSARSYLRGSYSLAWRLHRTGIYSWITGIIITSLGCGSVTVSMSQLLNTDPEIGTTIAKLSGTENPRNGFYVAMLATMVTVIAAMALAMVGRLRSEEISGRTELFLATSQPRHRYLGSHVFLALFSSTAALILAGSALSLIQVLHDHELGLLFEVIAGATALIPGLVLIIGLQVLFLGTAPKLLPLGWVVLNWAIFCIWIFPILNLPAWVAKTHPWGYLPKLPGGTMDWAPVLVETGIGLALLLVGFITYQRRDIPL
ncbi:MAG: ABC transporter permease [Propionibacteriaceae bacterium]